MLTGSGSLICLLAWINMKARNGMNQDTAALHEINSNSKIHLHATE